MDRKTRLAHITIRNTKTRLENAQWPFAKKLEVVTQYLVLGNMTLVAAITKVPLSTIRKWKLDPSWREIEAEIRGTQNIQLDKKLTDIAEKSLDATLDRVENGDFIYDQKSGEIRRKPVALRDVHRVAVDILTKRELIRGNATQRTENNQISIADQLKSLALEMAKWSTSPKKKVIELEEVEDAIYEEQETGLQAGTGVGTHQEAEPSPRPSGTEQSPSDAGEIRSGEEG